MEQAVHQTLINDIENLLAETAGVDETKAKAFRKSADALIEAHETHPFKQALIDTLESLRTRIHAQVEKRDADFETVITTLDSAKSALKDEKLKEAEDAIQKSLSIAGTIPGLSNKRRGEIDKRLDKIYPQMRKLNAWRHWGTTQAREGLIDQIKMMHGTRLEANVIVKTLRAAKQQWQDWEQSGDHSEHKLWKEFSAACDKAYEPCREIFKAQKAERKENLNKKRALITEIEERFAATDWKQPNWKELDKWLRQQRSAFYNIGHTEHKHHKTLKTRLDKIT
ncbi:MAG: DUF349 domain-containing protein, partial [Arenicellales bacterium]